MSSSPVRNATAPTPRKSAPLNSAWLTTWYSPPATPIAPCVPRYAAAPMPASMNPIWLMLW